MESLDRLLAELKAEYQESKKKSAELKSQPTTPAESASPVASVPSTPTIKTLNSSKVDSDLAQIKAEYEAQDKAQAVAKQEQLKVEHEKPNKTQESAKQEQLKAEYKEPNKAQEIFVKQEQPLAEKVVQKHSHVQTHREKVRQAQVWLKNLDKNSDERFWFDQFAFKYSSRIDAAIDYLQAVNEFD